MLASMVATEAAGNNRWRRLVRRERERERRPGELRQVERQRERQDWCRGLDEVDDNPGGACPSALFPKSIRQSRSSP